MTFRYFAEKDFTTKRLLDIFVNTLLLHLKKFNTNFNDSLLQTDSIKNICGTELFKIVTVKSPNEKDWKKK